MTPDQSLLDLSDTLFSVSVALYSVALVAFGAELAFGRPRAAQCELVAAGSAPAPDAPAEAAADGSPRRAQRLGVVGLGLTALGALAHAAVLLVRGLAVDRLPGGDMYEFATAVVLVAVVAYVVLALRSPALRHIGVFVLTPAVLGMVGIGLFLYVEGGPLIAALRSSWLAIHVSAAIIGFGIFLVSGIASVLHLIRDTAEQKPAEDRGTGLVWRLPASTLLDRLAHRTAVVGFPIWTFAVIAGAIWAESAWGRFWSWDPKETWSFIAWVIYAGYLHARTTAGWRGRPAAWVNVVGLAVMIVNLAFVDPVLSGLHGYADVG